MFRVQSEWEQHKTLNVKVMTRNKQLTSFRLEHKDDFTFLYITMTTLNYNF